MNKSEKLKAKKKIIWDVKPPEFFIIRFFFCELVCIVDFRD